MNRQRGAVLPSFGGKTSVMRTKLCSKATTSWKRKALALRTKKPCQPPGCQGTYAYIKIIT